MNNKYYVVTSDEALAELSLFHYPTEINITKTFKYRKSANKYGLALAEKWGHCVIYTFIGTEKVSEEIY